MSSCETEGNIPEVFGEEKEAEGTNSGALTHRKTWR